jgi:hypothetical protein
MKLTLCLMISVMFAIRFVAKSYIAEWPTVLWLATKR